MRSLLRLVFSRRKLGTAQIYVGLLIIRFIIGVAKCPVFEKFHSRGAQGWLIAGVGAVGFPVPGFFAWCAVPTEFVGGIFLVVGVCVRSASFLLQRSCITVGMSQVSR